MSNDSSKFVLYSIAVILKSTSKHKLYNSGELHIKEYDAAKTIYENIKFKRGTSFNSFFKTLQTRCAKS